MKYPLDIDGKYSSKFCNMTVNEFIEILYRIYPAMSGLYPLSDVIEDNDILYSLCQKAAVRVLVNELSGTDVDVLRYQLTVYEVNGNFDLFY